MIRTPSGGGILPAAGGNGAAPTLPGSTENRFLSKARMSLIEMTKKSAPPAIDIYSAKLPVYQTRRG